LNNSLDLPDYVSPCKTLTNNDFIDDLHIFSQFGTLTPTQIFTIFDQFVHWPEFESCAFNSMLEKILIKLYSNPEEMRQNELDLSHDEDHIETKEL
jgi:dimethyladenosine transferase 2, mitochondrial